MIKNNFTMKKLQILLLISLPQMLFAQNYKSLFSLNQVTSWNIFSNTIPGNTQKYFANFDTIVNGKTWKYFGKNTSQSGLVREETLTGKIWFKGINPYNYLITDTSEKLVCNFSLNLGDSFNYYYHQPYGNNKFFDKNTWIKVDSVFYFRGLKHIRFDTVGCSNLIYRKNWGLGEIVKFVMVEGMGTNRGFHYMFDITSYWVVQCNYRDSDLFYSNVFSTFPDSCKVEISDGSNVNELSKLFQISIYPNPVSSKLTVTSETTIKEIYIYDLVGKLIKQEDIVNQKTKGTEITIDELKSGIYIIEIIDIFDKKFASKFIKE